MFIMESPIKMDDFRGTTILGNPHILTNILWSQPFCCSDPIGWDLGFSYLKNGEVHRSSEDHEYII